MVDGLESLLVESCYFALVVDDVAEAIETSSLEEFLFGFLDGSGDAEAEA